MNIEQINKWFSKNTKLYNISDLIILYDYIKRIQANTIDISFSHDYKFKYISNKFKNIRPENIFKLNWMLICDNLKIYFPEIKIDCQFEVNSLIDGQIQNKKSTFKHDVYITINDKYDCAIEFFESKSHKRKCIDSNKESYTQQVVDYYIIHKEEQDINLFFHDAIHKILLLICASSNDHYTLSKVNFFKNNKNTSNKIKKQTEYFNKIIKFHKENKFNFKDFFKELSPTNLESEEDYDFNEFIDFLEEEYGLIIKTDEEGNCDYHTFASIILYLDTNISDILKVYKKIYLESMRIMIESQKEIIIYINQSNEKKRYLPEFLDSFLKNHIQNYSKPHALKLAFENLKSNYPKQVV